jgi:hypothetical protein
VSWPFRSLLFCLLAYFSSLCDSSITRDCLLVLMYRGIELHYSVRNLTVRGLLIGVSFYLKCLARLI